MIYAVSDLHVDFRENMEWVWSLSSHRYLNDALIVAGDVSDNLQRLELTLVALRERFAAVMFVPGNHELWVRNGNWTDSWEKFQHIQGLCHRLDILTEPTKFSSASGPVWLVPLYSWYIRPQDGDGSLFAEKKGEDPEQAMWADNYFVRWPKRDDERAPAHYLLELNERYLDLRLDGPIVSASHFLPRQDLIFSTDAERSANPGVNRDAFPTFNFSRVAGCRQLDEQIRALGSSVHVYGHQHRNRWRTIDGVLYVSNCLGYPRERGSVLDDNPHAGLVKVY
ncbi:MAG: putative phosphodiesterase [Gammaproteobacteria bacterium]